MVGLRGVSGLRVGVRGQGGGHDLNAGGRLEVVGFGRRNRMATMTRGASVAARCVVACAAVAAFDAVVDAEDESDDAHRAAYAAAHGGPDDAGLAHAQGVVRAGVAGGAAACGGDGGG